MAVTIVGNNTPTAGGVVYGDGTNYASTAVGTTGQALVSAGAAAPAFGILPIAGGGTNSTATPTAGGIGYGTGTANAYTAAGTSGQVLTSAGSSAPTWATAASGLTFISATSTSGVSQVDITSGFTTTYDEYLMLIETEFATQNNLIIQYYIDGTLNTTAANYESGIVFALSSTGSTTGLASYNAGVGYNYIAVGGLRQATAVTLTNTHSSGLVRQTLSTFTGFNSNPYGYAGGGGGGYLGTFTTGVTGVRIKSESAATFTIKMRLYGYQKS